MRRSLLRRVWVTDGPAVAEYAKLGFIPCDVAGDGVAETLDSAYGDFCIAQVAREAGMNEDAAMF